MGKAWWSKTGEKGKPKFSAKPVIVTPDLQIIERPTIIAACEARGIALTVPPTEKRREEKKLSLSRLAELVGVEGLFFRSKREGSRYVQLKLAEKGGVVRNLKLQPRFKLHVVNPAGLKVHITEYTADFEYDERLEGDMRAVALFDEPAGELHVVEESKGFATKDWELRRKWVETEYGITIRVT
jgi:hypothetical protein